MPRSEYKVSDPLSFRLGLGKDGVHSLTAWKEELVQTLNTMEAKTPNSRYRRTMYGGETAVPPVPTIHVQETSNHNISTLDVTNIEYGYAITSDARTSLKPMQPTPPSSASVYSDGFNTARSSAITMIDQAANSATSLLTFQEQQEAARTIYDSPTKPKSRGYHLPMQQPPIRKSSITYIRSDENVYTSQQPVRAQSRTPSLRLSNSLKKQNIPKLLLKEGATPSRSPFRKLTLLTNRDGNLPAEDNVESGAGTPPLSISKKTKKDVSGLRPLKLARSATTKARGLLRQTEILPEVVVRPPSANENDMFTYSFQ